MIGVLIPFLVLAAPASPVLLGKAEARMAESKATFVGTVLEVDTCAHVFSGFATVYQHVRYDVDDVLKGSLPRQVTVAHYIQQGATPITEDACLDPGVFGVGRRVLVFTDWPDQFSQAQPQEDPNIVNTSRPREGAEVGGSAASADSVAALELLRMLSQPRPDVVFVAAEARKTSVHLLFSNGSEAVLQADFFRPWVGLDPEFKTPVISPDERSVLIEATGKLAFEVGVVLTWTPSTETFPRAWSGRQALPSRAAGGKNAKWIDADTIGFEGMDSGPLRADLISGTVSIAGDGSR